MADSGTATHLSIGEVLGLLLEEFPDITISKIRFLESQGLIEPERTPSGYRKFFDDDVELLRLILREQREKFLPLRVIKDRLDSGEIEPDPTPARGAPDGTTRDRTAPTLRPSPPADARREASADAATVTSPDAPAAVVDDAPAEAEAAPLPMVDAPAESALAAVAEPAVAEPAVTDQAGGDRDGDEPSEETVAKHPAASRAAERSEPVERAAAAPSVASSPATATAGAASNTHVLPGVLLSREELCAMAAITDGQLSQLEEYGVVAKPAGGGELYGDDAVEVAAAAGGFLRAGVDARHLRGWRHSVDREVGLYEQLVLPVLRQRNPQARAHVAAQLRELDALGGRLRSAMTRAALRRYLET